MSKKNVFVDEKEVEMTWGASPSIREEFNGNYDAYLTYRRAEGNGQVRVLSGGGCSDGK